MFELTMPDPYFIGKYRNALNFPCEDSKYSLSSCWLHDWSSAFSNNVTIRWIPNTEEGLVKADAQVKTTKNRSIDPSKHLRFVTLYKFSSVENAK